MKRTAYNPEHKAWRGRSHRKGGELVCDLRDASMYGADLRGTSMYGANLRPDMNDTEVITRNRMSKCPECGAAGPHDDNGETNENYLSFSCNSCGMSFDAITEKTSR